MNDRNHHHMDGWPEPLSSEDEQREKRGTRVRVWIVIILSTIALSLFIAVVYVTRIKPELETTILKRDQLAIPTMEKELHGLLESYAVEAKYVSKRMVHFPAQDSVRVEWTIRVPLDLPLASITHELTGIAEAYDGKAFAVEDIKTGRTTVHLRLHDRIHYSLVFSRTDTIKRKGGAIALFVDGIEEAPDSELESFLEMVEPVGCILRAKRESREYYAMLNEKKKEILLNLHFLAHRDSESKFELSEDLPPSVIESRIRNIVREFPRSKAYFVTSERSLTDAARITEAAIPKSRLKRIHTSDIQYVDRGTTFSHMASRMNDLAEIAYVNGSVIGVLELREGTIAFLRDEIIRLQKRGFDFQSFSKLRRQMEKEAASG